jgi:hypothetical protein
MAWWMADQMAVWMEQRLVKTLAVLKAVERAESMAEMKGDWMADKMVV